LISRRLKDKVLVMVLVLKGLEKDLVFFVLVFCLKTKREKEGKGERKKEDVW